MMLIARNNKHLECSSVLIYRIKLLEKLLRCFTVIVFTVKNSGHADWLIRFSEQHCQVKDVLEFGDITG